MERSDHQSMNGEFEEIADELKARGHPIEAQRLRQIVAPQQVVLAAPVVEAVRLLESVQAAASEDPNLENLAARAALLSHQIQGHYSR